MTRRAKLRLMRLEERAVPSANRLFALSQDGGRQVAVYLATGPSTEVNPTYGGTGFLLARFDAYAAPFGGGVRVAVGDVTGDGVEDLVTAPGAGGGPHIKVFDGVGLMNGQVNVVREFFAFDASFFGGEYLAVGQVDTSTAGQEIIIGAGAGGGAHVRVFGMTGFGMRMTNEFFAFEGGFRGGVRVAAADTTGDGRAEVIVAAGPGGGPHVRIFDMNSSAGSVSDEFYAYDANFRGGVYVAAGELDGDATRPEIATGAGEGGGAHVRLWQKTPTSRYSSGKLQFMVGAGNMGARVGIANLGNLNGRQTLYVGSGSGESFTTTSLTPDPRLRAYNLNWVPDLPDLTGIVGLSTPIINPVVPNVLRFQAHDVNFIDTFSTTRRGGLNLST